MLVYLPINSIVTHSLLLTLVILTGGGCTTLFGGDDGGDKSATSAPSPEGSKNSSGVGGPDAELKQAKIWARLDQVEFEMRQQRARIRVLEKGMVLGLVPEELRSLQDSGANPWGEEADGKAAAAAGPNKRNSSTEQHEDSGAASELKGEEAALRDEVKAKDSSLTDSEYERKLAEAQLAFRDGRYGAAILAYESLSRSNADMDKHGAHSFWIGVSWMYLKEFSNAQKYLEAMLKTHPESPLAPRAKYHLARVERQLGFNESALRRLKDVIAKHPDEDAAEMARLELENMKRAL